MLKWILHVFTRPLKDEDLKDAERRLHSIELRLATEGRYGDVVRDSMDNPINDRDSHERSTNPRR